MTLHIVPSIDLAIGGGLGSAALQLHRQMLSEGIHCKLITSSQQKNSLYSKCKDIEILPIKLNLFFYGFRNETVIHKAIQNSDLVHCHGLYTHLNWCVGNGCDKFDRALVYHPHGTLAPWYLKNRRLIKHCVHLLFENQNFRLARLWRAVSENEAGHIKAFFPKAKTVVVPNGIHLSEFPSQPTRLKKSIPYGDSERKWLLFFGRIAEVKGLKRLFTAWANNTQHHKNWQLLIVGSDFDGHSSLVKKWIANFPAISAPILIGPKTGMDKVNLLNAADLFILPSLAEGLPLTVLEAMACHLPVILSSECNYSPEQIGDSGWVVAECEESLVTILDIALSEDDLTRTKRGVIGRTVIENHFTWKKISTMLEDAVRTHGLSY